jgi:hypothetical protein
MRFRRMQFRLCTVLVLVAISAVALSYVGQARRRWDYCWPLQCSHAFRESQFHIRATTSKSPYIREMYRKLEVQNGRLKWMWRREAFRFWEPSELAESASRGE